MADAESGPHRRRGAALQRAIFDAALQLIGDEGYGRLTMERVAVAAGTSKPVLYRRWSDKSELVRDALHESLPAMGAPPTGMGLRGELIWILNALCAVFAAVRGPAFHLILAEAGGDCRAIADERVFRPARRELLAALGRAADRGEIPAALVTDLVADLGPSLLRVRAIEGSAPDEHLVSVLVDEALLPMLSTGTALT
jgi:AcrR family transcriptional regulator